MKNQFSHNDNIASEILDAQLKRENIKNAKKQHLGIFSFLIACINSSFTCIFCGKYHFDIMDFNASAEHTQKDEKHRLDFRYIALACNKCNSKRRNAFLFDVALLERLPTNEQIFDGLSYVLVNYYDEFEDRYIFVKTKNNYLNSYYLSIVDYVMETLKDVETHNFYLDLHLENLAKDYQVNQKDTESKRL